MEVYCQQQQQASTTRNIDTPTSHAVAANPHPSNSNILVVGLTSSSSSSSSSSNTSKRRNKRERSSASNNDLVIDLGQDDMSQNESLLIEGSDDNRAGESDQGLPPPHKRNKFNNVREDELGSGADEGDGFDDDDNEETMADHNGGMAKIDFFGRSVEVRFLISSRDAGAIIGRGGLNITHLRKTFDAQITVPDCPSPERVLTIVASLDKVAKIVREILKFTEPFNSSLTGQKSGYYESRLSRENLMTKLADKGRVTLKPTDTEIRVLLHTSHAGGLIGKAGARITQLRRSTGSGIKIFSDCCPLSSERVCIVYGQPETVVGAVKAIVELVATFPIKGPTTPYDPKNCDPYGELNYGGFIANQGGGALDQASPGPHHSLGGMAAPILPHSSYGSRGGGADLGRGSLSMQPPLGSMKDNYGGGMPSPVGSSYYGGGGRRHSGASSTGGYSGSRLPSSSPQHSSSGSTAYLTPWSSRMMANDYNSPSLGGSAGRGGGGGGRADSYVNLTQVSPNLNYCGTGGSALKHIRTTTGSLDQARPSMSVGSSCRPDIVMRNVSSHDGTSTATIQVPNMLVGAIMGKGGYRIKEIRMSSMAEINIAKSKSPDNSRLITIKGMDADVQRAVLLIEKSIEANSY